MTPEYINEQWTDELLELMFVSRARNFERERKIAEALADEKRSGAGAKPLTRPGQPAPQDVELFREQLGIDLDPLGLIVPHQAKADDGWVRL